MQRSRRLCISQLQTKNWSGTLTRSPYHVPVTRILGVFEPQNQEDVGAAGAKKRQIEQKPLPVRRRTVGPGLWAGVVRGRKSKPETRGLWALPCEPPFPGRTGLYPLEGIVFFPQLSSVLGQRDPQLVHFFPEGKFESNSHPVKNISETNQASI